MPKKIVLIGAGSLATNIVTETIHLLCQKIQTDMDLSITMINRSLDRVEHQVTDIRALFSKKPSEIPLEYTTDLNKLKGADIIILAAGPAAGTTNAKNRYENTEEMLAMITEMSPSIKENARDALLLVSCNPIEIAVQYIIKLTGFSTNKVFGIGLELDANRFIGFLKEEIKCYRRYIPKMDIEIIPYGLHSKDGMLFFPRFITLDHVEIKIKLKEFDFNDQEIDKIINTCEEKTREEGIKHVKANNGQSAKYGHAGVVSNFIIAYLGKGELKTTAAIYLNSNPPPNNYNLKNTCIGLPLLIKKGEVILRDSPKLSVEELKILREMSIKSNKKNSEYIARFESEVYVRKLLQCHSSMRFLPNMNREHSVFISPRKKYLAGDYNEAIDELTNMRTSLPGSDRIKLQLYLDLGMIYMASGEHSLSFKANYKASDFWKEIYNKEEHLSGKIILLDEALKELEKVYAANAPSSQNDYLDHGLRIYKKSSSFFSEEPCRIFNNLGNLCLKEGNQTMALRLFYAVNEIVRATRDSSNNYLAVSYDNCGIVLSRQKKFNRAEKSFEKCLNRLYQNFEAKKEYHPHLASHFNNKGNMFYLKSNFELARNSHIKALLIIKRELTNGVKHPDFGKVLFNLAMDYEKLENLEIAEHCYRKSANIFLKKGLTTLFELANQGNETNLRSKL